MKHQDIDSIIKKIPPPTLRFENKALLKHKTKILKRSIIIWITSSTAAMIALILMIINFNPAAIVSNSSLEILAEIPNTNTIAADSISTIVKNTELDTITQIEVRNTKINEPKIKTEQTSNESSNRTEHILLEMLEEEIEQEDLVRRTNLASGIEQQTKVIVLTHTVISDISTPPSTAVPINYKNRRERLIDFSKNEASETQKTNRLKKEIRIKNEEFWGTVAEKTDKFRSFFNTEKRDRKPLILIAKE